jgi:hypothetical protein
MISSTVVICYTKVSLLSEDAVNRRRIRFMLQQTRPHRQHRREFIVALDDPLSATRKLAVGDEMNALLLKHVRDLGVDERTQLV